MLYRENEEFKLFPLQVTYKNSIGEEETNFAIARDTWDAYQDLGHITDLVVEDAAYSGAQLARLEEVKGYPEAEYQSVMDYVLDGTIAPGSHLAEMKAAQIAQETLDMLVLASLGVM